RPAAAAAAGAAFAFGGYSLSHTGLPWAVYEAPWPPLLFLAVERGINGRPAWGWLGPIAVALALLAGNPQEMYYSGLWLVLFAVLLILERPRWRRAVRAGLVLVGSLTGGFLLA